MNLQLNNRFMYHLLSGVCVALIFIVTAIGIQQLYQGLLAIESAFANSSIHATRYLSQLAGHP